MELHTISQLGLCTNFEDEISIRRGECSIPDFRSIIVEILIR
jgi:hypothetical protein